MQTKVKDKMFAGQTFYIGIDVHKKSWRVTILGREYEHKTLSQPSEARVLSEYLSRNFPGGTYRSVYEAGFCGFGICRELRELGVECSVIHPMDVPSNAKERLQKTDGTDSRKLARWLRSGDLRPIDIPDGEQEADRALIRTRFRLVKDLSRMKNRVKSLLMQFGLAVPENFTVMQSRSWSGRYMDWLEKIDPGESSVRLSLDSYLRTGKFLREELLRVNRRMRELSVTDRYGEDCVLLQGIPGVGIVTAMTFLVQIGDMGRFGSLDALAMYLGLVPQMHGSGDRMQVGGIIRRGRKEIKIMLIEAAWDAVRKDPAMMLTFNTLCKRMHRNKAIIRIARKLLNRIRHVLLEKQPYHPGVTE